MKNILHLLTLGAVALALPSSGFAAAAAKKTKPVDAPTTIPPGVDGAKKPADAPKPAADTTKTGEAKAMGMFVKVDTIDAAAKTFTHKNKDGKEVKFVVTDKTDIKNGDAP